ncbi:MAG: hypothetical protein HYV97_12330 [Bdellovibrio sp.]|nr:hypothetical protein [Bdellovibrio sp.]
MNDLKNVDDIITKWNKEPDDEFASVPDNFEQVISDYKKDRKSGKRIAITRFICLALMDLGTLPFSKNPLGFACMVILFFCILYLLFRYIHFNKKLEAQDYSEVVLDFIEHRRKIAIEEYKSLKIMRYFVYPAMFGINISHAISNGVGLEGKWYVAQIIFSLVITVIVTLNLEKAIKGADKKVHSLR